MERADLLRWIERYERAWRSAGTDALRDVFDPDVVYVPSPWTHAVTGLDALATLWEDERDGPAEAFTMTSEIVAIDGPAAVARVEVDYADGERWRDVWIMRFGADGRCTHFEEWPFAPDQPDGHK